MEQQRITAITIPLTDEQREFIRSVTGADVREVLMAGPATQSALLEGEVTSEADRALAEMVWESCQDFVRHMDEEPEIKRAFEEHIGHSLDSKVPNVSMLR